MKVSLSWLKDYVPIEMDVYDLADALTMVGLEVEGVTDRYEYLDSVILGRIMDIHPHPKTDDLKICDVDMGNRKLSIVCGAPNIKKDILAPVALPGTSFPNGFILERKNVRGVPSEGMLCSEAELGLGTDSEEIMVLSDSLPEGESLAKALDLTDMVLDIGLTPNRSDCLSIIGIAREIAALQNISVRYPDLSLPEVSGNLFDLSSVVIETPDNCPRYAARLLTDITVSPSPFWVQDRLMSIDLRPINNIVDITNFVMMETGQPLHAFDFDRLEQNRIVVRMAYENEPFTTLDQKEHLLSSDMLMICDGEKPVALAGIMGGLNSEIENDSKRVLIESAYFNPITIRRTSKKFGLTSEASYRFERGVDPDGTLVALNRAAQLIAEIGGGKLVEGLIDQHPKPTKPRKIALNVMETNMLLGLDLYQDKIENLLRSIEFKVERMDNNTLEVISPSFRVDIERPVDLMEEVARLWGYNNIATTYPLIPAEAMEPDKRLNQRDRIKRIMIALGFTESINYSFINSLSCEKLRLEPDDRRRNTVKILNPLSEEQTVMRTSLLPGLFDTMRRNISRQVNNLKLFEVGNIYINIEKMVQPEEIEMLACLWTGARVDVPWYGRKDACDFYDIKGVAEEFLKKLDIQNSVFTQMPADACRYTTFGHTAQILVENEALGLVGEIDPEVLDNFHLKQTVFIFEIDLNLLFSHINDLTQSKPIPAFPAVDRDVTLIVDRAIELQTILDHVKSEGEALVESIYFLDAYEGEPIPASKKSISFRITYRSHSETLIDERVNHLHKAITDRILDVFDATYPV